MGNSWSDVWRWDGETAFWGWRLVERPGSSPDTPQVETRLPDAVPDQRGAPDGGQGHADAGRHEGRRAHWSTFAFGYGMSAFGRPGGEGWSTFRRPGGEGWSTFAFGYGMSTFGRPGGAHGPEPGHAPHAVRQVGCEVARQVAQHPRVAGGLASGAGWAVGGWSRGQAVVGGGRGEACEASRAKWAAYSGGRASVANSAIAKGSGGAGCVVSTSGMWGVDAAQLPAMRGPSSRMAPSTRSGRPPAISSAM